jgi:hypothetical protein
MSATRVLFSSAGELPMTQDQFSLSSTLPQLSGASYGLSYGNADFSHRLQFLKNSTGFLEIALLGGCNTVCVEIHYSVSNLSYAF